MKDVRAAPLSERGHDVYETPPEAVLALINGIGLPDRIWEPACGPGSIVKTLRGDGFNVFASDLVDYGCPDQESGVDFLETASAPEGVTAIVTNPPYKLANEFVRHALNLGVPKVCMLLRLAFLEGVGRSDILDGGALDQVLVFRNRLPMMHRHGWTGNKTTSTVAFAWFCWNVDHRGPATLERISWKKNDG